MRPSTWSRDRKLPPLGVAIYDENTKQIGNISDIIGPVFKPYFKIKPSRPNLSSSSTSRVGEPLYIISDSRGKNQSKKGKFKEKPKKDRRYGNKYNTGKKSTKSRTHTSKSRFKDKSSK